MQVSTSIVLNNVLNNVYTLSHLIFTITLWGYILVPRRCPLQTLPFYLCNNLSKDSDNYTGQLISIWDPEFPFLKNVEEQEKEEGS